MVCHPAASGCSSTAPKSRGASRKSVLDCVVNAGVNQARDALRTMYPILYLFNNTIHMYRFRAPDADSPRASVDQVQHEHT